MFVFVPGNDWAVFSKTPLCNVGVDVDKFFCVCETVLVLLSSASCTWRTGRFSFKVKVRIRVVDVDD